MSTVQEKPGARVWTSLEIGAYFEAQAQGGGGYRPSRRDVQRVLTMREEAKAMFRPGPPRRALGNS